MLRLVNHPLTFYAAIAAIFVALHFPYLADPPNGFHMWREVDTATVTENFVTESNDFFRPRVNFRGTGTGVVGMELPIYNYIAAQLSRATGDGFLAARVLSLCASLWFLGALAWLMHVWSRVYELPPAVARWVVFAAAAAPLVMFYGVKIQPDVLGLAAMTTGAAAFWAWLARQKGTRGWMLAALTALMLAIAGAIKPTMLAIGLPMLVGLWHIRGRDALRTTGPWLIAVAGLFPIAIWFWHARGLTEAYGDNYFYLGTNLLGELAGLGKASFYQNTLITWPFELVIGIPALPFFVAGWQAMRGRKREWQVAVAWIVGAYIVMMLSAAHCATPHDYYYLPMVPGLAYVVGRGIASWLASTKSWQRHTSAVLVCCVVIYGFGRIEHRHATPTDVAGIRANVKAAGLSGLAVAADKLPGALLLWTGLKGWRIERSATVAELSPLIAAGAKYLVVDGSRGDELAPALKERLGNAVIARPDVSVYELKPLDGLEPTERLVN